MKKYIIFVFLFFFSLTLLSKEPIKLVYFHDFQPYSWEDNHRKMHGILIDILTEALQNRMKIPVIHKGYPWARAQMNVRFGSADAFATVPTDERRRYTNISKTPIVVPKFTIFTNISNPKLNELKKVKSLSDLKTFNLVHYIGSGWAKKNFKDSNIHWLPTMKDALKLLTNKKFDAFIDVSQVIKFNIKKYKYSDRIIEIPNVLDSSSFHFCVGKKSKYADIMPEFDKVINQMIKDGTLQKILDK